MVFGASTYRLFTQMLASSTEDSDVRDPWVTRMRDLPATVISTTLAGPSTGRTRPSPAATPFDVVARLKEESQVHLPPHPALTRTNRPAYPPVARNAASMPARSVPPASSTCSSSRALTGSRTPALIRPTPSRSRSEPTNP